MKIAKCLLNSVVDMWGILITLWMHCTGTESRNKVIYLDKILRFQIRENINQCFRNVGYDYENAKKVIFTEYALIFVFMAVSIFFSLVLFSLFPTIIRILSHVLIIFLSKKEFGTFKNMKDLQMFLMASSVIYAFVGIYRTIKQRNAMEELADLIIGSGKKRTSFSFFVSVSISMIVLGVKLMILRLLDFRGTSFTSIVSYGYFLVAELYIIGYWTRCTYGLYFLKSSISGFRKVGTLEVIPLFFTSRLAGVLKPLNIVGVAVLKYLLFLGFDLESSPFLRYLENNRLKLYYSIIHMSTYFKSSMRSRECFWHGDLKAQMNRLHFVEPILPLMILSCLSFQYLFRGFLEFFTIQYVLAIQFAHFFFITELFHTFSVVAILTPYLNSDREGLDIQFGDEKILSPVECEVDGVKTGAG